MVGEVLPGLGMIWWDECLGEFMGGSLEKIWAWSQG